MANEDLYLKITSGGLQSSRPMAARWIEVEESLTTKAMPNIVFKIQISIVSRYRALSQRFFKK
jgi:hypothetical protein